MAESYFIKFLISPNAFDWRLLSAFLHWSEFAVLTFYQIFLAGFAGQGVLSKDLTVWLDLSIYANTSIPTLFLGEYARAAMQSTPALKTTFASIKMPKLSKNHFFIFKKSEEEFDKLTFGNSAFGEDET